MQKLNNKMRHHYQSPYKRGILSFLLVSVVMTVGSLGMHFIEKMSYLDAFYFMSMIATAQGPMMTPATSAGKIFTAFMAFISVGTVVAALGFIFGPFLGKLWHIGVEHLEKELHWKDKN